MNFTSCLFDKITPNLKMSILTNGYFKLIHARGVIPFFLQALFWQENKFCLLNTIHRYLIILLMIILIARLLCDYDW